MFTIVGIDHLVLTVADVEASLRFYIEQVGLTGDRVDEWRAGEAPFPSVRLNDHTVIDLFEGVPTGSNLDHFCIVVADADLDAIAASGTFNVVDGPGPRWGARGIGQSLYVSDPDNNTVELRTYET